MKLVYHLDQILEKRNIKRIYLQQKLGLSSKTMAKFSKNESVSLNTIALLCNELGCNIEDLVEIGKDASKFLESLIEEKEMNLKNGLYHEIQILFSYNSNRIEGSKLSENETRYIYETNTIDGLKNTDDIIEVANHFRAFDNMLDTVFEPLNEDLIKNFHLILKSGTSDSRKEWFNVGDYKTRKNTVGGIDTSNPVDVHRDIANLINSYLNKKDKTVEDIIDFHYSFESIHPFQDGNGRVGRLIMFRECLKENICPFIIEDEYKIYYYRGLKEYKNLKGYLVDTCKASQDKMKVLVNKYE